MNQEKTCFRFLSGKIIDAFDKAEESMYKKRLQKEKPGRNMDIESTQQKEPIAKFSQEDMGSQHSNSNKHLGPMDIEGKSQELPERVKSEEATRQGGWNNFGRHSNGGNWEMERSHQREENSRYKSNYEDRNKREFGPRRGGFDERGGRPGKAFERRRDDYRDQEDSWGITKDRRDTGDQHHHRDSSKDEWTISSYSGRDREADRDQRDSSGRGFSRDFNSGGSFRDRNWPEKPRYNEKTGGGGGYGHSRGGEYSSSWSSSQAGPNWKGSDPKKNMDDEWTTKEYMKKRREPNDEWRVSSSSNTQEPRTNENSSKEYSFIYPIWFSRLLIHTPKVCGYLRK